MKLNPIYIDLINENIEGAYKFPFYLFCHRIPERTFKLNGHYFPVCARCTGIWVSGIGILLYTAFFPISYDFVKLLLLAILLLVPMLVDGISQLLGMRETNNKIRFFTGLLAGIGLIILSKAIRFILIT